ncbi:GDSL family lysophospholipase PlaA [Legionella spiritensis]|uniref:Lysophospholipase A n=1 Tax=Legionella spiritensis TaxID=452 RepID=A0A0W0ZAE0_LEGSP|nr:SGNH/GDSL hydrolase family protein [Legionella spiritensis]KTD66098.1 lysophospholipase A [Legionella spiritensis]SNV44198.1 lysophospholipase A [Legionella spiritensis]VEG90766.1 lysophospholipase A [Legionella spiritensis]
MKVITTLLALFFASLVSATPLKNIVIFGDSLSDNGNLYEYMQHEIPQSPPYYEGRFTNGPVWVERLVDSYYPNQGAAHLLDYAFGGAGVADESDNDDILFTLKREVDSYLLAHQDKADESSLFIVWIGANNYLSIPDNADQRIAAVNAGIANNLARLARAGAKHVLVLNLPDLGQTPMARLFEEEERLSYFSSQHNEALASTLAGLRQRYPDVQWLEYDVNHLLNNILADPERYGFSNTVDTCFDAIVDKPSQQSILKMVRHIRPNNKDEELCAAYLFFDPVHPAAPAHQLMANDARLLLDRAGIKFH